MPRSGIHKPSLCGDYRDGLTVDQLATRYFISIDRVKHILYAAGFRGLIIEAPQIVKAPVRGPAVWPCNHEKKLLPNCQHREHCASGAWCGSGRKAVFTH